MNPVYELRECLRSAPQLLRPRPDRLDPVEDRLRDLVLGGERDLVLAVALDDHNLVLLALEADLRAGDVVEDDRVGALALELLPGPLDTGIGFRREADEGLALAAALTQRR